MVKHLSCDTLRAKINTFLATKEMTQTKFLETIGANSNSFRRFMSYTGRDRGRDNSTYEGALVFFAEREKKEKMKKEEQKEAEKQQAKAWWWFYSHGNTKQEEICRGNGSVHSDSESCRWFDHSHCAFV
jgi:hypothetical protein